MMICWHTLIVQRLRSVHIHDIAEIWNIWLSSCDTTLRSCRWVLCTLVVSHYVVAWVIRMIGWHDTSMSLMCCRILLRHALVIIGWWVILVRIVPWHVSLTWLWANSMKSTKSWTLLIVFMMVVAIHVSSIAYRSSSMSSIVSVWTQEIVSVTSFTSWVVWLIMNLDVCLPELV
jgi:hypothetical protein